MNLKTETRDKLLQVTRLLNELSEDLQKELSKEEIDNRDGLYSAIVNGYDDIQEAIRESFKSYWQGKVK